MSAIAKRWTTAGLPANTPIDATNVNASGNGDEVALPSSLPGSAEFLSTVAGFRVVTVETGAVRRIDAALPSGATAFRARVKFTLEAQHTGSISITGGRTTSAAASTITLPQDLRPGFIGAPSGAYAPAIAVGDTLLIDYVVAQSASPTTSNGRLFLLWKNLTNPAWNGTGEFFHDTGYTINAGITALTQVRFGKMSQETLPGGARWENLGWEAITVNPAHLSEAQARAYFADPPTDPVVVPPIPPSTFRRAPGGSWEPGWFMPGVLYTRRHPDTTWTSPGRPPLPGGGNGAPATLARFTDSNQPAALRAGESFKDNMPAGVPVRRLSEFTPQSTDFRTMMERIESQLTVPSYIEDDIGVTFTIGSLRSYGASDFRGWTNQSRRMMGLIGHPSGVTRVVMQPTAVSSTPGAAEHSVDMPESASVGVFALYLSNTQTDVPLFWSGITFDGTLQTPYRQFTTEAQGKFRTNATALSPLPWRGVAIWRAVEGSRFQFLRLRGFSFTVNTSPPFELGALESNYGREVYHRIEIDGRIASEFTASRPRASGGLMLNKPDNIRVTDLWQHHTRRSGFAMNTNSGSTAERMSVTNLQAEEVANVGNDGWPTDAAPGTAGGFNGSNLEEMVGVATYRDVKLNVPTTDHHINLATPYLSSGSRQPLTLPGRPIVVARNVYTDDALYGGCLRISVSERPNSTGVSPAWTQLTSAGIAASNLLDIRDANGDPMIGIRHTEWNARQNQSGDAASFYPKSRYFVVRY